MHEREQRVVIGGEYSNWTQVVAGVPQGSILGPLLFIIYINDIVHDIGSTIKLFADDTSLSIIVDDPINDAQLLNNDLEKIQTWAKTWLVTFNPNKTVSVLISRKTNKPLHPPLKMNNIFIKEVLSHKHLGLNFNNTGTWNSHIDEIATKAWKRLHIMRKFKFLLDRSSLQQFYFTFIRPVLEYADIIWSNCTLAESETLEKIQIEAARIVTGTTKLVSIHDLFREVGWEKLHDRREKHKLIKFFNMKNKNCPEYLNIMVPNQISETTQYSLRNSSNIQGIPCRTSLYSNSFLPSVIRQWNELPNDIKQATSVRSLKSHLDRDHQQPPKYYNYGKRKEQILHTRLRLNCSSLNHHLFSKNIIDDPHCTCGDIESTSHFLLYCNNYSVIRQELVRAVSNIATPSLKLLLYGDTNLTQHENETIFKHVQKFVVSSKRFT